LFPPLVLSLTPAVAAIQAAGPRALVLLWRARPTAVTIASGCAARLGAGLLVDITGLDVRDRRLRWRPTLVFGGSVIVEKQTTTSQAVATVRPNVFRPGGSSGVSAEVVPLSVEFTPSGLLAKVVEVVTENAGITQSGRGFES